MRSVKHLVRLFFFDSFCAVLRDVFRNLFSGLDEEAVRADEACRRIVMTGNLVIEVNGASEQARPACGGPRIASLRASSVRAVPHASSRASTPRAVPEASSRSPLLRSAVGTRTPPCGAPSPSARRAALLDATPGRSGGFCEASGGGREPGHLHAAEHRTSPERREPSRRPVPPPPTCA